MLIVSYSVSCYMETGPVWLSRKLNQAAVSVFIGNDDWRSERERERERERIVFIMAFVVSAGL